LPGKLGPLGDIRRDPPRLVAREELGPTQLAVSCARHNACRRITAVLFVVGESSGQALAFYVSDGWLRLTILLDFEAVNRHLSYINTRRLINH
jgi:hypothetical protein